MKELLFLIILVILIILLSKEKQLFTNKINPCTDYLSDKEFLEHMIPHHQVAIDMSKRLLLHTKHNYLIEFCRNLIIEQQGEIYLMNNMLLNRYNNYSELLN